MQRYKKSMNYARKKLTNQAVSRQNKTNHATSRQTAPAVHQKSVPLLSLRYFRSALLIKSVLSHGTRLNVPLHRVKKEKSSSWKSGADTLKSRFRHFA